MYRVPAAFADASRLRPVAATMPDYAVFEPRIWRQVMTCSTIDEFIATLTFQVHRRPSVDLEKTLDAFPSFEAPWRRAFSSELKKKLRPSPDTTCQGLHRVLPAGVSHDDALKCIQTALPDDLTDPYALTVASEALDDQCGAIIVTQRTHHVVVNVQCTIDPGILTAVCRELRTGHRQITQELSKMQEQSRQMQDRFDLLQATVQSLKELVIAGGIKRPHEPNALDEPGRCNKRRCNNLVIERFANGKRKKQCPSCIRGVVDTQTNRQ